MGGRGAEMLEYGFTTIENQTYDDFEVVVTDHSVDTKIEELCDRWISRMPVRYFRVEEKRGSPSYNTNMGINYSRGDIVKFLYQDDYLYSPEALKLIAENFDDRCAWMITDYIHTRDHKEYFNRYRPFLHERIHLKNLIGTPSCVAIRNKDVLFFDENLRWAFDCEYYKRMYLKFGMPCYLNQITIVNYLWEGQVSAIFKDNNLRVEEKGYVAKLYGDEVRNDEID
jgi:glycosyltransferase involved in cell wall biosynthesis